MVRRPEPVVFVVDDEPDVGESVVLLLRAAGLRGQAFTHPVAFLEAIRPELPGCVLLDVRMPRVSGLEVQRRLLRRGARQPVVFVSGHGDIPMALRAVRAGALDFLEKPVRADVLIDVVRRAIALDAAARAAASAGLEVRVRVDALTAREREVAEAVADGVSNREIATRLGLSVRTVEMHRGRAIKALGARSTAELITLVHAARGR